MNIKFFLSLVVCCVFALNSFAADKDRIVAEYEGKPLYKSEVESRLKFVLGGVLPDNKKDFDDLDTNTKQAVIQEIIQQKALQDDMNNSKIKDSKMFIQQVEEAKTKAALDVYLQNLIRRNVTDSMVKTEYNNYVNMLKKNPEIKVSHILVATKEEADKLLADIRAGQSFESLASKFSMDNSTKDRGGEIGFISKGQTFPDIEKAAYSLKVNEVSEPIKTQAGWHLLKVLEIKKREIPSFDAIKPQLEQQVGYKFVNDYMKKLIQNAKVKIFPNKTDVAAEAK
jgi:peptidyl-prolyl cis-trans isomerase C